MPLPAGLEPIHISRAVEYVEHRTGDWVDLYFEQANVFSAIVGMAGIKALNSISPYKKHKHPDIAQQRFPDLSLGGRLNPPPELALESRAAGDRGPFSLTTIMPAGISSGDTWSIPQ